MIEQAREDLWQTEEFGQPTILPFPKISWCRLASAQSNTPIKGSYEIEFIDPIQDFKIKTEKRIIEDLLELE